MALKITSKQQGTGVVSKEMKQSGKTLAEESVEEKVALPAAVAKQTSEIELLCEVGLEASYTHNLGNYQSARVGVSLKIPCAHAEIDGVFEYAQQWVDGKMQTLIADLQNS